MTPTQAYYFTLEQVEQLRHSGIEVLIQYDAELEKEGDSGRQPIGQIHQKLWCQVSFANLTKAQVVQIHQSMKYLAMCGISFDFGGAEGHRDWELDWSFRYEKGQEQMEWKEATDYVDELINLNPPNL